MISSSLHAKYINYHYCIIRECKNTSIKTAGKSRIRVPSEINIQKTWLKLAKRDPDSLSTETWVYLCEDHFNNSPLYIGGIGTDTSTDNELSRQWLVHTALDALEERLSSTNANAAGTGPNPARTDMRDLYLGLLYSTDTHKIYGYVTNTRIKLVLVTNSASPSGNNIRDAEVRTALRRLHALYADAICNPFHLPGNQITSAKFDKQVKSLMLNNV